MSSTVWVFFCSGTGQPQNHCSPIVIYLLLPLGVLRYLRDRARPHHDGPSCRPGGVRRHAAEGADVRRPLANGVVLRAREVDPLVARGVVAVGAHEWA